MGWLYGSLHVGRLEWSFPGPRLAAALREADAVALELDIADPATVAQLQQGFAQMDGADAPWPAPTAAWATDGWGARCRPSHRCCRR